MAYPRSFLSKDNFELAFTRVVRGGNKEYKSLFRHLYPSYNLSLDENIADLIDDIRRGRYEPSSASVVYQPKRSSILRPLRLLTIQDQVVYQAIANFLANKFKKVQDRYALKRSFGAILGSRASPFFYRSWKQCYRLFDKAMVRAFQGGNVFVADFDLVSFYELIDHKLLRDVLQKRVREPELLDLLFSCLERWSENQNGSCLHHGIPQGPEPSAFLAECVLFSFDATPFKDVVYLRYVDDIRLMAKTETPARRGLLKLDIASKGLGLVPQAQKIECRRVGNINELRKSVPSKVVASSSSGKVTKASQKRLERILRASLDRKSGEAVITDFTKFKFSLLRLNRRKSILKRLSPLLVKYPDLSWVMSTYFRKFPEDKFAADSLLAALQRDPTYDASAANYIDALSVCEPPRSKGKYRRVIQTAERRSEEKSLLLKVAAATFRGQRSGPTAALELIKKEKDPLAKTILIHRLFGRQSSAPFKVKNATAMLEKETESSDADLARFCADLLIDQWPWRKPSWTPTPAANNAVKLLLKGLGLRARRPKKKGILERFFEDRMKIGVRIPWKKALGVDWRDAERRCLRTRQLEVGDPSSWVLMLDTFNEVLVQRFSIKHAATSAAYRRATPGGRSQPDYGNWLRNPALASTLPKAQKWFADVHAERVKADLAHAKSRRGVSTKPVSFETRVRLLKVAPIAWAEMIIKWRAVL